MSSSPPSRIASERPRERHLPKASQSRGQRHLRLLRRKIAGSWQPFPPRSHRVGAPHNGVTRRGCILLPGALGNSRGCSAAKGDPLSFRHPLREALNKAAFGAMRSIVDCCSLHNSPHLRIEEG